MLNDCRYHLFLEITVPLTFSVFITVHYGLNSQNGYIIANSCVDFF